MQESWEPIRVLIVDDHPVVRHGLQSLLSRHGDLEIVASAEDGAEILPLLAEHPIDVILLDIKMKNRSGIDAARQIRQSYPDVRIIILTTFGDESYLHDALEAGVDGFLLKSVSHENLPDSIRAVMAGEKLVSPNLVSTVVADYQKLVQEQARRDVGLTVDDLQLLAAMAEGASNKDLAEQFHWSEATIKRMVQDILEKLAVANRTQAVAEALRRGWI